MRLPSLEKRVEMFLSVIADKCKTCITRGNCHRCLAQDARVLRDEWRRAGVANEVAIKTTERDPDMSDVETSVLAQVKLGQSIRGDAIRIPAAFSLVDKRQILRSLVARGKLVSERRYYGKRFYRVYMLPTNETNQ